MVLPREASQTAKMSVRASKDIVLLYGLFIVESQIQSLSALGAHRRIRSICP